MAAVTYCAYNASIYCISKSPPQPMLPRKHQVDVEDVLCPLHVDGCFPVVEYLARKIVLMSVATSMLKSTSSLPASKWYQCCP